MGKINWYPGHMAKATSQINQLIKEVDLIIEIVDARAINSCLNPSLAQFQKPILTIATKADLADLDQKNSPILLIDALQKQNRTKIIQLIEQKLVDKKKRLVQKGLINPIFRLLVVGLPNVGKSQIINLLTGQKRNIVQNKPGLTKNISLNKINHQLFIYDSPGIMFKKIEQDELGFKLALVNTIKLEILPLEEIVYFAFVFIQKHYPFLLEKSFQINSNCHFEQFINHLAHQFNFFKSQNEIDLSKTYHFFFHKLINGEIGKINYEKE